MANRDEHLQGTPVTQSLSDGSGSASLSGHSISRLLIQYQAGSPEAKDALLQVIYDELRQIALRVLSTGMTDDESLGITGLVHEAYLHIESTGLFERVENRRQLFCAVHRAMRQVLADRARDRVAQKRGEPRQRLPLDDRLDKLEQIGRCSMVRLHESLETLAAMHSRAAEVIDLRLLGELDHRSISDLLEVPLSTVDAEFRFGRAVLFQELSGE